MFTAKVKEGCPVGRLRAKLNSQRGASLLLAMLFLLLCMMVAASVLMAAASNAGKLHSNRVEQQKYLTLSSALRLVCGELSKSSYRGCYTYQREDVTKTVESTGEDGKTTTSEEHDYYIHTYAQQQGLFQCGLNTETAPVLPLADSLDRIFAARLATGAGVDENPDDQYTYTALHSVVVPAAHTLTVAAGQVDGADVFEEVTIAFEMREDGIISLAAGLQPDENGHVYTMLAELVPKAPLDSVLVLDDTKYDGSPGEVPEEKFQTEKVEWQLHWIAKKGVGADEP